MSPWDGWALLAGAAVVARGAFIMNCAPYDPMNHPWRDEASLQMVIGGLTTFGCVFIRFANWFG